MPAPNIDPAETQVTLGDKTVEISQFDRYKGGAGRTDRLAVLSSKLIRAYRYYHPEKKQSFRAPIQSEPLMKLLREALGEPEQRFGLTVFHYTTDEAGALLDKNKCAGKVKIWSISESRYAELSNMASSWPLLDGGFTEKQVDILVKCTEEKFQRMQFTPCPEAHWKLKQSWYDALKKREALSVDKVRLALGRPKTDAELRAMLESAPAISPTGVTANASDVDLTELLEEDDIPPA